MLSTFLRRLRELWTLALTERATPRQIALAVGVGVFAGCTPAMGLHGWIAVGIATILRLNRLWCFVGSRVSNVVILPWIVLAEVQIAHRLRTGAWVPLTAHDVLAHGRELLLDWCLGTIPVGGALGAIFGVGAYAVAARRARRAARARQAPPPPAE